MRCVFYYKIKARIEASECLWLTNDSISILVLSILVSWSIICWKKNPKSLLNLRRATLVEGKGNNHRLYICPSFSEIQVNIHCNPFVVFACIRDMVSGISFENLLAIYRISIVVKFVKYEFVIIIVWLLTNEKRRLEYFRPMDESISWVDHSRDMKRKNMI